jgi:hypothetical protein
MINAGQKLDMNADAMIIHQNCNVVTCQLPTGDRASFRNGWWSMGKRALHGLGACSLPRAMKIPSFANLTSAAVCAYIQEEALCSSEAGSLAAS